MKRSYESRTCKEEVEGSRRWMEEDANEKTKEEGNGGRKEQG